MSKMDGEVPDFDDSGGTRRRLTKAEWNRMKEERNYEGIFANLHASWHIGIQRLRPIWCEGWLDTIEFDPDAPLDLNYIQERWGGGKYRLRVLDEFHTYETTVTLTIAGEPKLDGRRLKTPEEIEQDRRRQEREDRMFEMQIKPPAPPPAPSIDPVLAKMLERALAPQKDNSEKYLDLLIRQIEKQGAKNGRSDMKELLELAQQMRQMREMFGDAAPNDGWADAVGKFADVLGRKTDLDSRQKSHPPKGAGPVRMLRKVNPAELGGGTLGEQPQPSNAPAPASAPTPAPASLPEGSPAPPPAPASGSAPLSRAKLAATLAEMSPEDAADVVGSAFTLMSPEDRETALQCFVSGGMIDEDELEDGDDDETPDGEEDKRAG